MRLWQAREAAQKAWPGAKLEFRRDYSLPGGWRSPCVVLMEGKVLGIGRGWLHALRDAAARWARVVASAEAEKVEESRSGSSDGTQGNEAPAGTLQQSPRALAEPEDARVVTGPDHLSAVEATPPLIFDKPLFDVPEATPPVEPTEAHLNSAPAEEAALSTLRAAVQSAGAEASLSEHEAEIRNAIAQARCDFPSVTDRLLLGAVMRRLQGRANPSLVLKLMKESAP